MKTIVSKTFTAAATLGLFKGYSKELIPLAVVKEALFQCQEKIKKEDNVALSTKISLCEILFLGQDEPSITLDFIQYPKFPIEEPLLKKSIIKLISLLMVALHQNRTLIVFQDETICLEQTAQLDPTIHL